MKRPYVTERNRAIGEASEASVAEWMSENGGSLLACANDSGMPYTTVKRAWKRICAQFGWQAA